MRRLVVIIAVLLVTIATSSSGDVLLETARHLYRTGRYDEALEQYATLQEMVPMNAALGEACVLFETGRHNEAEKRLKTAAETDADDARPAAALANLYLYVGRHNEALQAVDAALAVNSEQIAARWVRAELLQLNGKLDEANHAYAWLVDYYNATSRELSADDLRWVGLAAAEYARWNRLSEQFTFLVNELYPDALAAESDFWPAPLASGRLFLEKFNEADAARELAVAQKINPNSPDILAALAELAIQKYELDKARQLLERVNTINPRHIRSLLLQADIAFAEFDPTGALAILERARKINPHHGPTLGRLAAAYGLVDGTLGNPSSRNNTDLQAMDQRPDRLTDLIAKVTARNPRAGLFYYEFGQALDKSRKFPDAVHCYAKSVAVMPRLVGPRAQLGLMQLRLGDEAAARIVLGKSFDIDPFNVRVKNSLAVLDLLAGYEDLTTEHFIIRFDPKHDRVLAKCLARYLERIYPELTARLGYSPKDKTLIELFSRAKNTDGHGWFSARMVGLPRIHTIAACAGKMIAVTSPTSMSDHPVNWARVLRHEMVHVINLQQTDFNIPHWYTEALAVLLENQPRPKKWDELLVRRVPKGDIFNLDTINAGFIKPSSSDDWQMAYCQAELYAEYMLEHFGNDALIRLLGAYTDKLETDAAIRKCFGVSVEEFEHGYAERLSKIANSLTSTSPQVRSFADLKTAHEDQPEDADTAAELAVAYVEREEYKTAKQIIAPILKKNPKHQLSTYIKAKLLLVVGEHQAATERLAACLDEDRPRPEVLKLLAALRFRDGEKDEAQRLIAIGAERWPNDLAWTRRLAAMALKRGAKDELTAQLRKLADAEGNNLMIRKKLARLATERGDHESAARWAEDATHISVLDLEMHTLAAKSLSRLNRHSEAADAYEICVELAPQNRELRLIWAKSCQDAGQTARAKNVLMPLVAEDNAEAKQLLKEMAE